MYLKMYLAFWGENNDNNCHRVSLCRIVVPKFAPQASALFRLVFIRSNCMDLTNIGICPVLEFPGHSGCISVRTYPAVGL